jgi:hypothetical protein
LKYFAIAHEVEANVIVGVGQADENGSLPMCLDNGENLLATPHMFGNSTPTDGDYAVVRWNNLVDIVPKATFETMYSSNPAAAPQDAPVAPAETSEFKDDAPNATHAAIVL